MKKPDPEKLGKLLAAGGSLLSLAIAAAALLRNGSAGAEDEEDYTAPASGTKSYNGYVPTGCRACGGPYPLCKMGCAVFDDD